jgi:hypothetical protein
VARTDDMPDARVGRTALRRLLRHLLNNAANSGQCGSQRSYQLVLSRCGQSAESSRSSSGPGFRRRTSHQFGEAIAASAVAAATGHIRSIGFTYAARRWHTSLPAAGSPGRGRAPTSRTRRPQTLWSLGTMACRGTRRHPQRRSRSSQFGGGADPPAMPHTRICPSDSRRARTSP